MPVMCVHEEGVRSFVPRSQTGVLAAYGWHDIDVPTYTATSDTERARLEAMEAEIVDRLFVLHEQRALEESSGSGSTGGCGVQRVRTTSGR